MRIIRTPFSGAFSRFLFCLTLIGATPAVEAGGPVVGWGAGAPPPAVSGVDGTATAIAAGGDHNCAIQAGTGSVVCWGEDPDREPTPPDTVNGVGGTATAIAVGVVPPLRDPGRDGNRRLLGR